MEGHDFTPPNPENDPETQELRESVRQLGALLGLNGLRVEIQPGEGWKCIRRADGITVVADPEQLAEQRGTVDADQAQPVKTDKRYTLHTSGHEISHGKEFIDPEWRELQCDSSDQFFWNVIHDTAIDKRLRAIPALDAITDDLYGNVLFPTTDLTGQPRHIQLMYSALCNTVTNNEPAAVDPEVAAKLEALTHHEAGGEVFNIFETLADPRTSLRERRLIAERFIMPAYHELLEIDKQAGAGNAEASDQSQTAGDSQEAAESTEAAADPAGEAASDEQAGDEAFEKHYQEYDQKMNSGRQQAQSDDTGAEQQEASPDHVQEIADALDELAQAAQQQAKTRAQASSQSSQTTERNRQEMMSHLAGTVAAEMELSEGDARKYVESLDTWGATIRNTADVLLQLAAPTTATMSPRYNTKSLSEGVRLHPQRLAHAALQLASEQPQPIWQPIERRANQQKVAFGGLDIHLVVDVSQSMQQGSKAECAAACSQILLEGIGLARHKASLAGPQHGQPDVRTQAIAFGSSTKVIAPLAHAPSEPEKGKVFCNLLYPKAGSTLVSGALAHIYENAAASPNREALIIIISDGDFHDTEIAKQQVQKLPDSAYVAHLVIGEEPDEYISQHHQLVINPGALPETLYDILRSRIKGLQAA